MSKNKVIVTVVAAKELKNKDGLFGKNDAYCNIKVGNKTHKTKVIYNAGSKATWNETFQFECTVDQDITVQAFDYDKLSLNDFIGVVRIPLLNIRNLGISEQWWQLTEGNKKTGQVHLKIQYVDPSAQPPQYAPNANVPPQAGGYPPQQGGGYPPQQGGGYPPQQGGGYPPQQGGYPPQQGGGYPPQQGGYPPQQGGGYPPQQGGGYPPQQGSGYPPKQSGGYPPY